jgi:hypothetical protein
MFNLRKVIYFIMIALFSYFSFDKLDPLIKLIARAVLTAVGIPEAIRLCKL